MPVSADPWNNHKENEQYPQHELHEPPAQMIAQSGARMRRFEPWKNS